MTLLRIEARDPLVFRDGRPNDGRSESRTLDFPLPSVIAGALRAQLGRSATGFNASLISTLLTQVSLRGPLLASEQNLFVPAPADALLLKLEEDRLRLRALGPIPLPAGAQCSRKGLPEGLQLVGLAADENDKAKPSSEAPRFWSWEDMEGWLKNPGTREHDATQALCKRGLRALPTEERIHVALGPGGTAEDGKLFAAEGLRFFSGSFGDTTGAKPEELALLVDVDVRAQELGAMTEGLRPLGGERRLARWRAASAPALPPVPPWLLEHVRRTEKPVVRVVLLTPAFVNASLTPDCLSTRGARVLAAKVDRPRTVSGWDMAKNPPHGQPKRTRRLAAAGSVYWVELSEDEPTRCRWVEEHWMQNLGDDETDVPQDAHDQLRRDGFGLAVIGVGGRP